MNLILELIILIFKNMNIILGKKKNTTSNKLEYILLNKLKAYFSTSPGKLMSILILCVLCTAFIGKVYYYNYSDTRQAVQTVGKDTIPSIVAAENIYAVLADANANAMNGVLTRQNDKGIFWKTYRTEMSQVYNTLITATKNIAYGDEEQKPISTILTELGKYENEMGTLRARINTASVYDFLSINKIMREKILPAARNLDKANFSHLNSIYTAHRDNIGFNSFIFWVFTIIPLVLLILSQIYIFRKTHRIINIGLCSATIVVVFLSIYANSTINITENKLIVAKQDAFDSIHLLWKARAVFYDVNADESLYLLFHGNKAVQSNSTSNFKIRAALLTDIDPQQALYVKKFGGFLGEELANITFKGEHESAISALENWAEYIKIDGNIRNLENQGKHNEAIALHIGNNPGESNWQFAKFDKALGETLDINQKQFDSNIKSAFDTLNPFPVILVIALILIVSLSVFGIKERLDEYRF